MAWRQFLIAFLSNVAILSFGLQAGWLSPLQPHLQSTNSPLGAGTPPLTDEQISWIGSLPSIAGVIAPLLFGYTMDRFGRKTTLLCTTLPNLVAYLMYIFSNNVTILYIARFIGGFCGAGAFTVAPIYINETVMPHWRATLGSLSGFFIKLGIILSYIFGSYTSYLTLNLMSFSFTAIFLLFALWLPESPAYLLMNNKTIEAEAALLKIWGVNEAEKVNKELYYLETHKEEPIKKLMILKRFLTVRKYRRGMFIVGGIFSLQVLSGYPAIVRYTVDIFNKAGTSYSSDMAAIFLAIAQIIFSFLGAVVLERVGRKKLVLFALISMGSSLSVLSIFLYLKTNYPDSSIIYSLRFLPTIALIGVMMGYASGFGTVPFMIMPELFSPENRAVASTITNLWYAVGEFVVLKVFPSVTTAFGLSASLGVFAILNAGGIVYISTVMFETMGLDFETIQRKLDGRATASEESTEPIENLLSQDEKKQQVFLEKVS